MLETVVKYDITFYVMGIMMVIGVVAKLISYITVKKIVKAASEIQKSNHRLMRLVKAKFEHASMVSDKVQNVEAFVQKYLYEYKAFLVQLNTWRMLPSKTAWFILMFGILGMLGAYQVQGMGEQLFQYGSITAICVMTLISIHILTDEKTKLEAAKNYMVEYLENVCIHRYEKANQVAMEPEPEVVQEESEVKEEVTFSEEKDASKQRMEQEMRIRAILEEFLA